MRFIVFPSFLFFSLSLFLFLSHYLLIAVLNETPPNAAMFVSFYVFVLDPRRRTSRNASTQCISIVRKNLINYPLADTRTVNAKGNNNLHNWYADAIADFVENIPRCVPMCKRNASCNCVIHYYEFA